MAYQKKDLLNGVLWSGIEKITVVLIQLFLELILARNLEPKDYGVMGMVAIFISLGVLFAESGFSNALIHNQHRREEDFSTAFYFNILMAIMVVVVIFIVSPFAAIFFKTPILENIMKVTSVCIIFNAASMVYRTKLNIDLDFKTQTKVSFLSLLFSGIIGVILAIKGFGVWSLVVQMILQNFLVFVFFLVFVRWKPLWSFSFLSFNKMFHFGFNVLLAGFLQSIYTNLYNIFIGERYSAATLGLYSKSNQFTFMPSSLISGILQRILFPYFSSFQGDDNKIFKMNQLYVRTVTLVLFPFFIYLAVFSEPLVYYGLTERWMGIVPIIRILSIAYLFQPIIANNMNLLQVKNKTGLYFRVEMATKIVGFIILLLTINHGIKMISLGILIQLFVQFLITGTVAYILLKKNFFLQFMLVLPYLIYGGISSIAVYFLRQFFSSERLYSLIWGSVVFLLIYMFFYIFAEKKNIKEIMILVRR